MKMSSVSLSIGRMSNNQLQAAYPKDVNEKMFFDAWGNEFQFYRYPPNQTTEDWHICDIWSTGFNGINEFGDQGMTSPYGNHSKSFSRRRAVLD